MWKYRGNNCIEKTETYNYVNRSMIMKIEMFLNERIE